MQVIVQITGPQGYRQQVQLYNGQVAQFGRTDWADFSFPNDAAMAELQFLLDCTRGLCQLKNLDEDQGTRLNGQPVKEALLRTGDRITAGRTQFEIQLEGVPQPPSRDQQQQAEEQAAQAKPKDQRTTLQICEYLDLEPDARALAKDGQTPDQLLELLTDKDLFAAAVRLQAHLLPRREAVWWGCRCVEATYGDGLPAADQKAVLAARQWALQPGEETRRAAEQAANATKLDSGGAWMALAAFWSGGSISEPTLPEVEPDARLLGQALTGALLITASYADPSAAPQRYRNFLATARQIARGEVQLPAAPQPVPV
ncbi:MAG: hypothetical protein J5I93_04645 [Pirellulaceae bacterium]|nr:hypothetical protein [Pirellulaceae bacterium]